ncbi:outer membrane protein assembly factor BamA [Buchnera aphidicola]|uniref:outer membrane protein assembly factor BamA n=1 Tax=Buchnera aphidicola TaxID=9 RepID=UPI0034643FEA
MLIIRCILLLFFLFYSNICFASTDIYIKKINILGLHHMSQLHILDDCKIYYGHLVAYDSIKKNILKLYKTGFFNHITLLQKRNKIIILFEEKYILKNITIIGNRKFKKKIILDTLRSFGIRNDNFTEKKKLFKLQNIIKKLYNNIEMYNTKINIHFCFIKKKYIFLKINIIEGRKFLFRDINVSGNKFFSYKKIISFLNFYPDLFQKFIFHHKKYNNVNFKKHLIYLKNLYYTNGYISFLVKNIQFSILKHKKYFLIFLNIFEGLQYTLSSIVLDGNFGRYQIDIQKIIHNSNLHQKYDVNQILLLQKKIENFFENIGFLQCKIFLKPLILNINSRKIILHIYIDLQNRFLIKKIVINGNKIIHNIDLHGAMKKIFVGSYVNLNIIQESKKNIRKINYIDNVDIKIIKDDIIGSDVKIIYTIREKNPNTLNINCGYSTFSGLNIRFQLDHDYWMGYNIKSVMHIIHNNYHNYIDLLYKYQVFLHNVIFSNRIFYNYVQNNIKNILFYKNKNYGLEENIKCTFSEYQHVKLIFGYIVNNILNLNNEITLWKHIKFLENNIHDCILDYKKNSNIMITYIWKYNSILETNFPDAGVKSVLNVKFSLPGGFNNFYKISFSFEKYLSLLKSFKYVLHTFLNMGFGSNFHRNDFPFYENFSFHENNNVRGFMNNSIGPRCINYNGMNINKKSIILESNSLKSNYSIGGNIFILSKLDLIIPNFFLLNKYYDHYFETSLFLDFGNLWDTFWKNTIRNVSYKIHNYNNPYNMNISTGVQIKWISPVGPISLSYSFPVLYTNKNSLEPLQFNMNYHW